MTYIFIYLKKFYGHYFLNDREQLVDLTIARLADL